MESTCVHHTSRPTVFISQSAVRLFSRLKERFINKSRGFVSENIPHPRFPLVGFHPEVTQMGACYILTKLEHRDASSMERVRNTIIHRTQYLDGSSEYFEGASYT